MHHSRLFTWWRLFLLLWIFAVGGLWGRSYYRADGLNYRTAAGTHWNLRGQSGVLVLEVLEESPAGKKGLWFYSADGVWDLGRWGPTYSKTTRIDLLGFIWITGSYVESPSADAEAPGMPLVGRMFFIAPARALAIPCWFLLALPALLLALLLYRAIRLRHRLRVGHCPACGYDLRASPERCPECGRPSPSSTPGLDP